MTREERIYEVVSSVLHVAPTLLNASSSPDTFPNWDSLRHLQVVLALEEAFAIQFSVEEIEAMHSVGVIDAIVGTHVPEQDGH